MLTYLTELLKGGLKGVCEAFSTTKVLFSGDLSVTDSFEASPGPRAGTYRHHLVFAT